MISPSQRPLLYNKQHSQETTLHASVRIRTRNPSKRAPADLRFRPRVHWDRLQHYWVFNIYEAGNVRVTWYWGAFALPLLSWESNKYYIFWVCVSSLSYPARKAHALNYSFICRVSVCATFSHIVSYGARFSGEKKVIEHKMCVLIFSTIYVWHISNCKMNCAIYCHICRNTAVQILRYSCQILIRTWFFFRQIFVKSLKYRMLWKYVQLGAVLFCPERQTRTDSGQHYEVNSRISQFRECVFNLLTLIVLTWRIGWAHNNARK